MTQHTQLEDRQCPCGQSGSDELVLEGGDRLHNVPGRFQVVRCRACGLMRTNPRPTPAAIGAYYPEDYAPYLSTVIRDAKAHRWRDWARGAFAFNSETIPPTAPGSMLEIGCASGQFMHVMAQRGWRVAGIESSPSAARAAQAHGYHVHVGPVEDAPAPADPLDLVVGWMVMEHLHEPVRVLDRLWQWTRPGGWLAISVPNCAALEFRVFGDAWFALQLPTHLFHYTPATLTQLLERSGWRVRRIMHQRIITNLPYSLSYCLKDRRRYAAARIAHLIATHDYSAYLLYPLAVALAALGQTGRMTIWAQREAEGSHAGS
jgi:2-polyprenyl-3-methyl-5-hydroxy-6-metoxy-1,4-benzoquinol methylase